MIPALALNWLQPPARLATVWGGRPATTAQTPPQRPLSAVALIMGPPGRDGSLSAPTASLVADVNVLPGQPVCVSRLTGHLLLADALVHTTSFCIGLAEEATPAGFVCDVMGLGGFTLPDWTAIAGTADLAEGQTYFLAEGGGITLVRPTAKGSSLAIVGVALTTRTLDIRRGPPILL